MATQKPNRIAELRKAAGLTQQQIGEAAGVHWITVSKLERGKTGLTLDWMNKLAPLLSVSPTDLMPPSEHTASASETAERAARLKTARAAKFNTQIEAIRLMGVQQPTYTRHENGSMAFSLDDALLYAQTFGVSPSWLAWGIGDGTITDLPDLLREAADRIERANAEAAALSNDKDRVRKALKVLTE